MNQTPEEQPRVMIRIMPDVNPWEDPEALPRLRPLPLLLLALLTVVLAVYPSARALHPLYTPAMLLVCVLVQLALVRSLAAGLLSLSTFALGALIAGLEGGTGVACVVSAISLGAYLITRTRSVRLCALPLVAYALAFALCRDATEALLSLVALPAALSLAYATIKNVSRVGVVCATSAAIGGTALLAACILFYRHTGQLSLEAMLNVPIEAREGLILRLTESNLTAHLEQLWNNMLVYMDKLSPYRVSTGAVAEQLGLAPFDRAAFSRDLVNGIYSVLPALAVLASNLVALNAQTSCRSTYVATGVPSLATRSSALFVMSVPSAVIFLICGLIALFSDGSTVFAAAVCNVTYILFPPMCLIGFFKTVADLRSHPRPFFIVILIVSAAVLPYILLIWLAVSGALATLMRPLVTRMLLDQQSKGDRNDHNGDHHS